MRKPMIIPERDLAGAIPDTATCGKVRGHNM